MKDSVIYADVATEVLEVFNYLNEDILLRIPKQLIEMLYKIKNPKHLFKIDKNKSLTEQNMLKETKEILSVIYLKYCCSKEKADKIIMENNDKIIKEEEEKRSKYNIDDLFKNDIQKEVKHEDTQITIVEDKSFSIIRKIKKFFKKMFGRKEK